MEKVIIRQRGQITIPESLRQSHDWLKTDSVVLLSTEGEEKLVIKPIHAEKKPDWKKIWRLINLSKSFKGKRGNLSEFIAKDRYRH